MNLKTRNSTELNFYKALYKKTPELFREFLFKKLKINYEFASSAIKFNAEPATNQPI